MATFFGGAAGAVIWLCHAFGEKFLPHFAQTTPQFMRRISELESRYDAQRALYVEAKNVNEKIVHAANAYIDAIVDWKEMDREMTSAAELFRLFELCDIRTRELSAIIFAARGIKRESVGRP